MMKLIKSECKKILKNKLMLCLILFMAGWMGISTYDFYQEELPVYKKDGISFKTFEGDPLTNWKDARAYADQVLSQYEGEANKALWERYCSDYNQLLDTFSEKIDQNLMTAVYGTNYEALLTKAKTIGLSREEVTQLEATFNQHFVHNEGYGFPVIPDEPFELPVFYEKQEELSTLEFIYRNNMSSQILYVRPLEPIESGQNQFNHTPLYFLSHKDKNIKDILKTDESSLFSEYVKQDIEESSMTFGSSIGIAQLEGSFSRFSFMSLLLISILLANSFAIEKRTKMDQLIVPSQEGSIRICLAKISAALGIGMLSMIIQIACVLIVGCLIIMPAGWNLPMIYQAGMIGGVNLSYLSYQDAILANIQLLLLGAFAVSVLTTFLSCITKSQFLSVIISMLFILCPFFMTGALPQTLMKLLPCFFTDTGNFLYMNFSSGSPLTSLFGSVFWWKDVAMLCWIGVGMLMIALMLLLEKRHVVQNR